MILKSDNLFVPLAQNIKQLSLPSSAKSLPFYRFVKQKILRNAEHFKML